LYVELLATRYGQTGGMAGSVSKFFGEVQAAKQSPITKERLQSEARMMDRTSSSQVLTFSEKLLADMIQQSAENNGLRPDEVQVSPSKLLASPSELLASPSERSASPSELFASPSELSASPSELLVSPSELLASPSERSASPSELLVSPSELPVR
jgi:hypothetical protein